MANERDSAEIEVIDINAAQQQATDTPPDDHQTLESADSDEITVESSTTQVESAQASVTDDFATDSDTNTGIEQLQAQLESVKESIATYKDQLLRSQAEQQNIRRRMQRDVENAHKYALEKFSQDLLPIVDSLELSLGAMEEGQESQEGQEGFKAVRDGVELSLKMFLDTLAKHNITQIDPQGEPFDPQFHEAMSMIPNADVEPNTVIAVMQKGYTLNERLVRPARVIVAKAVAENTEG